MDFYGDGRAVYAVVIQKDRNERGMEQEGKLLLAGRETQSWKVEVLEDEGNPGSLWHALADEFVDMYQGELQQPKATSSCILGMSLGRGHTDGLERKWKGSN